VAQQHWLQKGKTTWHEYGLGVFLLVAALVGGNYIHRGDVGGAIGITLFPAILWVGFYWQHSWRSNPKPLTWVDTAVGMLAWCGALAFMISPEWNPSAWRAGH